MSPILRSRTAPRLRTKLLIAFTVIAFATAACGALSLLFVNRIGSAITVYADITSPLQAESAALVDTAHQMRIYVIKAANDGKDPQTISTQLDLLDAVSRTQLNTLRALADRIGIKIAFDSAELLEKQYVAILRRVIEKSQTVTATTAVNDERYARFESLRLKTRDQLRAIVDRADGFINESEEKAVFRCQTFPVQDR